MRLLSRLVTLATTAATLAACGAAPRTVTADDPDVARIAAENNAFTLDVLGATRGDTPRNTFLSPFSINAALSMTYAGARGQTADEMARVLHVAGGADRHRPLGALIRDLSGDRRREYTLHVANRIWAERNGNWNQDFLAINRDDYGADAALVDIRANPDGIRAEVNAWVADQTRGIIADLLPPGSVQRETTMVLANAIYFKGDWARPFEVSDTRPEPFTRLDGSEITVDRMHATREVPYAQAEGYRVAGLPYGDSAELRMWVLLPDEPAGLPQVEASLSAAALDDLFDGAREASLQIGLPRLELRTSVALADALTALGMPTAFTDDADFTGMRDEGGIQLSDVFHQAYVKVDEEGTVAAAATGSVVLRPTSAGPQPIPFLVDRPYLFFLRDELSGAVLFVGRVVDPRS